jgi:fucose permease
MSDSYSFKSVFAAACLGMLLFGITLISLGSLMPSILDKFQLDTLQAASLASILPGGILLGSLLFGPIVDRYSYKYVLIGAALFVLAGLESIALANGLFLLQVAFACIGIGGGTLNGATNALVADISDQSATKSSANLSLLGVFFGIGALGMPVVLGLFSAVLNVTDILHMIATIVLLMIVFFLFVRFPTAGHKQGISLKAGLGMLRDRYLLLMGLFLFFQSAFEGIINNWATTFLQEVKQLEVAKALMLLSVYVLSLTLTRLFLTALLRKVRPYIVLIISILLLLIAGGLLMGAGSFYLVVVCMVLLGMGTAGGFPVVLGFVGELFHEMRGTAFSIVLVIALLGNMLINYLMGLVAHQSGIEQYPWVVIACGLGLLLIASLGLRRFNK